MALLECLFFGITIEGGLIPTRHHHREASTPFVQARWFILQHIGKDTTIYIVNGLMMMVAFFGACVLNLSMRRRRIERAS